MADITEDLSAIMADFAQKSISGNPVETPSANEVSQGTPEAQTAEAQVPTEQTPSTPEVKKEEPKIEDKEEGPFSDWDNSTTAPVVKTDQGALPVEVFNELGKVLGLDRVQSKEDLVTAISTIKAEAEKAKTGIDKTQIHPELQKAIELSQKGGDFYSYLKVTSADYSQVDPVQLYEDYVIEQFADEKGQVDEDKVNNFLDNLPEADKELRGRELQKRLIADQNRQIAEIENEAIRKKEKHDAELKSALSGLSELDGFKVDDRHRREVYDWVNGKMMKDLFYGPDGNIDPQKVAKNAFRMLYYEKLDAYQKSKIRNSTKREVLSDLTNAQITSPAIPTNVSNAKKGYDINDFINSLEQKMINR